MPQPTYFWNPPLVDQQAERPFDFTQSPQTLGALGATAAYPSESTNHQHEMELLLVLGAPRLRVTPASARERVYGHACGPDMTRRDLQQAACDKVRPWDLGKDIEQGSLVSEVLPLPGVVLEPGELALSLNGQQRPHADPGQRIWGVGELALQIGASERAA
jgi:fumarylpyruvate hydrolase